MDVAGVSALRAKQWSVAFTCSLLNFMQASGFFFTATTLMPLLVVDFGLDLAVSTVPIAVGKIAYVVMLIPGGMLVDLYGPRSCVLVGLVGLALCLTAYASLATAFSHVLFAHVCMSAVASVSGVPVYSIFIAQWFDDGIGLAMGLTLAGFSFAGTAVPALLGPIGAQFGWRAAMGCMSAALWLVAFPAAWLFLEEKHGDGCLFEHEEPDCEADPATTHTENTPLLPGRGAHSEMPDRGHMPSSASHTSMPVGFPSSGDIHQSVAEQESVDNKSWTFIGFGASYILLQYSFGSFGENILFWLTIDDKYPLGAASLFFSAMNMAAFSAKLIGGHLGDRYDRFRVGAALSGIASMGVMCLFVGGGLRDGIPRLTSSPLFLAAFAFLFGFGYGGVFNCLYVLVPLVFGKKNLGKIQSSLFGLGLIGNAAGSIITAQLRSLHGSYDRAFLIAGAACVTNFFVFNLTRTTLGGTMAGLKKLAAEVEPSVDPAALEQLEADERAIESRIGGPGDMHVSGPSRFGSHPGLHRARFFEASFSPSPSVEQLYGAGGAGPSGVDLLSLSRSSSMSRSRMRIAPPWAGSGHFSIDRGGSIPSTSSQESLASSAGGGVSFESGFPLSRDWSMGSMQRREERRRRRAASRGAASNQRPATPAIRQSPSVLDNLLSSGIVSQSFEDIGYGGFAGSPAPSAVPTPGGFRRQWLSSHSISNMTARSSPRLPVPAASSPPVDSPRTPIRDVGDASQQIGMSPPAHWEASSLPPRFQRKKPEQQ